MRDETEEGIKEDSGIFSLGTWENSDFSDVTMTKPLLL